jgi:uncharacterized protein YraI
MANWSIIAALVAATPLIVATAAPQSVSPNTSLNLRAAPDRHAPVVGVLRPGVPAQAVASTPDGWLQVQSSDGPGWAYGEFYRR